MDAIFEAIESGESKSVKQMLKADPSLVNTTNDLNDTPLHVAVWQGNKAIAGFLIKQGADVNAVGNNKNTPLHFAAQQGDESLAKSLIQNGADLEAKNRIGFTPLFTAIRARALGGPGVAGLLLREGAFFDLNSAVALGRSDRVKELLDADPALKAAPFSKDLLEDAIQARSIEIVKLLLEHGIDPNSVGMSGNPAIFAAVRVAIADRNPEILQLLLDHGADVNAKDGFGGTLLSRAMTDANRQDVKAPVIELLRNRGAK
jgi:ankyrin repeat protein